MISSIRVISVLLTRSFLQTPIADPVNRPADLERASGGALAEREFEFEL